MKSSQQIIRITLVITIVLFSHSLSAQYSPEILKQDSIIKAKFEHYERKSPAGGRSLTKSQNKWLHKNGFYIIDYKWDDPDINLNLDKTLKHKRAGNIFLGLALSTVVLGYFANAFSKFDNNRVNGEFNPTGFYVVGGSLTLLGLIMHGKSNKNFKKAKALRKL